MAKPALDSGGTYQSTTGVSSLTFSHTCASGSAMLLCVGVAHQGGTTLTNVKYNNVTMTDSISDVVQVQSKSHLMTLVAPTSGANNVVVTVGANTTIHAIASSWTNVNQSVPVGTGANTSSASASSLSIAPASSVGTVVIDFIHEHNTSTGFGVTASQTLIDKSADQQLGDNAGSSFINGTATTTTVSWGWSFSGSCSYVAIAMNPTADSNRALLMTGAGT